jgi:ribokinase
MSDRTIVVMGSCVTDLAFRTAKLPAWGETYMGSAFSLGPGGKGSNQAVAAARAGARVSFISKRGRDSLGEMARQDYRAEGIDTRYLCSTDSANSSIRGGVPVHYLLG